MTTPQPNPGSARDAIRGVFEDSIAVKRRFLDGQADRLADIAVALADAIRAGGKILFCGNGGSAADAQHLAAELLVRLRPKVNRRGLPALALAMDSSTMTACGNDYSFDDCFARVLESLGRPGDVLVGITTSGRSRNVIRALQAARRMNIRTVGFLGGDGLPALRDCDLSIVVPSDITGRVQECHITAGHVAMQLVEDSLLASGFMKLEPT